MAHLEIVNNQEHSHINDIFGKWGQSRTLPHIVNTMNTRKNMQSQKRKAGMPDLRGSLEQVEKLQELPLQRPARIT